MIQVRMHPKEVYPQITHMTQQVSRNQKRFPEDFMFQLTKTEAEFLRLQFATSKPGRGGRRSLPYAFTEQGVAMLSSVLNSERVVRVLFVLLRVISWIDSSQDAKTTITKLH
jgi:hypothetical protein